MCRIKTEMSLFMAMVSELRLAQAASTDPSTVDDLYDEIEGVMLNTDDESIRAKAKSMLYVTAIPSDIGII